MITHDLKILPEFFGPVIEGRKTFEIRKNDRGFQKGDTVRLLEWDGMKFTGDSATRRILYIFEGPGYGIEAGFCVMALGIA